MADQKISELTALTGANLADVDAFAVVDTSAVQTKKITYGELKAALDTGTGFVRITGDTMTGALNLPSLNVTNGTSNFTRTHSTTTSSLQILDLKATSSGDMADGFGPSIHFSASDTGTTSNQVAEINVIRAGSDTAFNLELQTADATRMTIGAGGVNINSGNLGINATPTQRLHVGGNAIITGITRLGNGTVTSPAYQFVDDTNTGMYRSSSDVLGFSTGGGNRLTLNSTGATFAGNVTATSFIAGSTTVVDTSANITGATVNATGAGMYIGGTQFIDSSRNLLNLGTVASGKVAITGGTATSEASHATFTNTQGAKTYAVGAGQSGVTNNGFVIRNVTDNSFPLVISDVGAATFNGTVDISGGRIALTGQSSGTEVNSSIRAHTNNYTYMFGGSSGLSIANNTGEDTRIKLNDGNTMQMYTSATERLKIDSNGDISFYNDSAAQGLYWDASTSRLGLGVTAPSSPLTVNATSSSEGIRVQRNGVSSQYISIHEATGGDHVIEGYGDKAMNIGNTNAQPLTLKTNNQTRLTIDASGNLGLGVIPARKLHIYNTAALDVALLESTQVFSTLAFKSSSNASTVTVGIDGAGNASFTNKLSSGHIKFATASTDRITIDNSGRVGINSVPNTSWRNDASDTVLQLGTEATLHSDANVTTELWNNAYVNNSDLYKNISTRGSSRYMQYEGNHRFFTSASASAGSTILMGERLRITDAGRVGIGDSVPQDYLEINGSGRGLGGLTISNSSADHAALSFARSSTATARIKITEPAALHTSLMKFETSNASGGSPNLITAMTIDQNQNVGISSDLIVSTGNLTLNNGNADSKYLKLNASSSGDGHILLQRNNANKWQISSNTSNNLVIDPLGGSSGVNINSTVNITGGTADGNINIQNDHLVLGSSTSGATNSFIGNVYNSNDNGRFDIRMRGTALTDAKVTVLGSGRVGIGIVQPTAPLEISNTAARILAINSSHSNGAYLVIKESGVDKFYLGKGTAVTGSTNGYAMYAATGYGLDFNVNGQGSPSLVINSSGNVGVGVTSIQASAVGKTLETSGCLISGGTLNAHQTNRAVIEYNVGSNSMNLRAYGATSGTGVMIFSTGGGGGSTDTERMRIDHLGNFTFTVNTNVTLKITTDSTNPTATSPHILLRDSAGTYEKNFRNNSGASSHYKFYNPNGEVGQITTSGSATAYNTSSDYRLKENVDYTWDATTRLKQLKPARFNFIADADTTVDGFLAHEVSSVVPEAITGAKDAVDADGNPEYQGIDQSKLVPLLIKTIQELEARITALEA